jgi:CheY-like chemotaxis protein
MVKILLVEDDDLMIRMYNRLFTIHGYQTEIAENGEEGFTKAKQFQPDLILLDVMMPKMNGLELVKKLKEDEETKDIIIVLLTNLGIQEKLDEAIQMGVATYIIKSNHQPEEIIRIVEEQLIKKSTNIST